MPQAFPGSVPQPVFAGNAGSPQFAPSFQNVNPGQVPTGRPRQAPQLAAAPKVPQPKIRLQAPDDVPPAQPRPLALPAPEDLGLAGPVTATADGRQVDWNAVRVHLARLGALSFRVDRLGSESYRVTFVLATAQPQRTHQVECTAGSEAAAVELALARAQQVAGLR
jgi:hypothetical protein